ncbi:MAG TPA: helix-turn-helix domain-containing protein [Parachlamydiaceae bacterium]|nr:helix-turn-helix domain-containing protein [Parachlamydiaceae bacterium]
MCPRKREDNEKIREQTSIRLLEGALKVFAKNGYHASSMSEIAKEAGVSKGLAYHYFSSKEDLLVSIAEQRLQEYLPLFKGLNEIIDAEERLNFLVNFVFGEIEKKTDELRFYNALYLHADGVRAIGQAMKKYQVQFDQQSLEEEKLLRDLGFTNPELEAIYFRSILQGISLEYMLNPKDYPLKQMKEMLISRYKN